jgi:hypothetical protein
MSKSPSRKPDARPPDARKADASCDDILSDQDMAEVMRTAVAKAKTGNEKLIRLVELHWRRRDRPIALDLPAVVDARSLAEAHARVIEAATDGKRLTPRQGLAYSTMLAHRRRALELVEVEEDLAEIEEDIAREKARGRR